MDFIFDNGVTKVLTVITSLPVIDIMFFIYY